MTETYASAQTEGSQFLLMHRIFTLAPVCCLRVLESMQDSAAKHKAFGVLASYAAGTYKFRMCERSLSI